HLFDPGRRLILPPARPASMRCSTCDSSAVTLIGYSGQHLCEAHFRGFVERRVKHEIRSQVEFRGGERVAVGLSGGKDSSATTVLLHDILAPRGDIEIVAITVDEGIASYRPDGIRFAKALCEQLGIEHHVGRSEDPLGWYLTARCSPRPRPEQSASTTGRAPPPSGRSAPGSGRS